MRTIDRASERRIETYKQAIDKGKVGDGLGKG